MIEFEPDTGAAQPGLTTLARLEENYGLMLPEAYVSLLRQSNGGVPTRPCFMLEGHERLIERFLCILDDPQSDDEHGMYDARVVWTQVSERLTADPDEVGASVLPIAALFAGDLLCLDFREDPVDPAVVVWEHEQSPDFHPHFIRAADTLPAFLQMLQPGSD